jgi:hypothetical protein
MQHIMGHKPKDTHNFDETWPCKVQLNFVKVLGGSKGGGVYRVRIAFDKSKGMDKGGLWQTLPQTLLHATSQNSFRVCVGSGRSYPLRYKSTNQGLLRSGSCYLTVRPSNGTSPDLCNVCVASGRSYPKMGRY